MLPQWSRYKMPLTTAVDSYMAAANYATVSLNGVEYQYLMQLARAKAEIKSFGKVGNMWTVIALTTFRQ